MHTGDAHINACKFLCLILLIVEMTCEFLIKIPSSNFDEDPCISSGLFCGDGQMDRVILIDIL